VGLVLDHPLLPYYPVGPLEAKWIEDAVDRFSAGLDCASEAGDLYQWLMLHQGRCRLDAFTEIAVGAGGQRSSGGLGSQRSAHRRRRA
jgi:hypothetical protein